MSYTPTNWQTGDIVSSERLNKLENGVKDASERIEVIEEELGSGGLQDLSVGTAEQLLSDDGTEDKEPYVFRVSDHNSTRLTDKIVGGTIAWNQLIQNGNFAINSYWGARLSSVSISNGIATVTPLSEGTLRGITGETSIGQNIIGGHRYYMAIDVLIPISSQVSLTFGGSGSAISFPYATANAWTRIELIWSRSDDATNITPYALISASLTTSQTAQFKNFIACDMTQMFGSAIAEQIAAMETATAGAGVAFFKSLFPKPYYAYNAGELMSVNTSAHVTRGFNAWDEEWEVGKYNLDTGAKQDATGRIRTKNKIRIDASKKYYFKSPTNAVGIYKYADDSYLGYSVDLAANTLVPAINLPSDICYLELQFPSGYGDTYKNDICLSLPSDRDGQYEPYESHTYPLDSSLTLRGVPKLDANNKVYYDGDTYESDGKVTRRYGIIDLGAITSWNISQSNPSQHNTSIAGIVSNTDDIFATKYINDPSNRASVSSMTDGHMVVSGSNIFITSGSGTNPSGYLVYRLATPTTETADPFTNPQICSPYGTEEYVDSRDVAVPVGHDTFYHEDLKGKIEGLPWDLSMIAPIENGATASQAYAQGKFFMRNNQFCKAKTSIASGASFTLGTNYEVTTVAAELFSALS